MTEYILLISSVAILLILGLRYFRIKSGKIYSKEDGLKEFIQNTSELNLYFRRLFRYLKKTLKQYAFHFLVRMLYYIKLMFDKAYSYTRNKFLKTTIKDKKAVSRFWVHLKEYKQEIDVENKLDLDGK